MRYDVSVIGLFILDILGRPVTAIPDRGNVDYEKSAKALAAILDRIAAASQAIGRANDRLPDGKAEVAHFEPFNGTTAVPDQPMGLVEMWISPDGHNLGSSRPHGVVGVVKRMAKGYRGGTIPGTGRSAVPHVPLLSRIALPRTSDPADGDYWRGGETKPQPPPADELAILRFHGLRT